MSFQFFVNETLGDEDDLQSIREGWGYGFAGSDPQSFAEAAAEYCHDNRDGWEWHWPKLFVVFKDGVEVARFEIDRENKPCFHASKIKKDSQ